MTDINIDDFFKDGARVLSQLYSVFPRRHSIFVEDICGAEEPDEFGMRSQRHMSCFGTLLWLGEEGYLRYEEAIRQEAIDQAVLSARCFTVLSTPIANSPAMQSDHLPHSVRTEQSTKNGPHSCSDFLIANLPVPATAEYQHAGKTHPD